MPGLIIACCSIWHPGSFTTFLNRLFSPGHYSLTLVNFPPCDFDHFTPYFGQFSPLRLTLLPPVKWLLSPFPLYQKSQFCQSFISCCGVRNSELSSRGGPLHHVDVQPQVAQEAPIHHGDIHPQAEGLQPMSWSLDGRGYTWGSWDDDFRF